MSWNDGYERKKFEAKQKKQAEEYRALGMTEDQIKEMYEFDFEQYKSDRRNAMHTQPFSTSDFDEGEHDDSESTLYGKFFHELSCDIYNSGEKSRYFWIEEIENDALRRNIKKLDKSQIELLTLIAFDGFNQEQIAKMQKCTQSAIAHRLETIKKILKKN